MMVRCQRCPRRRGRCGRTPAEACNEEGNCEVDDSPNVWGAIGLGTYTQDDTVLPTVEVDVLDEFVPEYIGSCTQRVVDNVVMLDEMLCINIGGFLSPYFCCLKVV